MDKSKDYRATAWFHVPAWLRTSCASLIKSRHSSVPRFLHAQNENDGSRTLSAIATIMLPS